MQRTNSVTEVIVLPSDNGQRKCEIKRRKSKCKTQKFDEGTRDRWAFYRLEGVWTCSPPILTSARTNECDMLIKIVE